MIKKLNFTHYRKLKNVEIDFLRGVNIISGTNGTCKTSILHLISNSFQEPRGIKCMKTIRSLNNCINPKIETLTKGDKIYANPAIGTTGILYSAEYYDGTNLEFRRKNDKALQQEKKRFRIIPKYSKGTNEKLPDTPVIYLGLSRLMSSDKIDDRDFVIKRDSLPKKYHDEIADLYKELTKQEIDTNSYKTMQYEKIKTRAEFSTTEEGIDSNTISDGQDNIHIILTALVSLKYYFDETGKESILLIDEADSTLHPDLQLKLLKIFKRFSSNYNIQITFTTHSLDFLEEGIKREEYNVIYLDDDIEKVREELRNLIQYIDPYMRPPIYSDFEDTLMDVSEDYIYLNSGNDFTNYKKKLSKYFNSNLDNIVVWKIRHNEKINDAEKEDLERILFEELGTNKEFEGAYGDKGVVEVVRNIIGLDPATASEIFSKYINENQLNMKQIQFVKLLIDYVIKNGTIDMIALTEDPFRALGEVGDLLEDKVNIFMQIRKDIESINENAKKLA